MPDAHTDFIFAAMTEELGIIVVTIILLLYLLIITRSFIAIKENSNLFIKLILAEYHFTWLFKYLLILELIYIYCLLREQLCLLLVMEVHLCLQPLFYLVYCFLLIKTFLAKLLNLNHRYFMAKNIIISAGGTGGHLAPALAIAKKLAACGHKVILY